MTKNNKLYPILFIVFLFAGIHQIKAADSYLCSNNRNSISDSLIIKHRHSDKTRVIKEGQMIKVWYVDHEPVAGVLRSAEGDKILLDIKDGTKEISKKHIYKIHTQTNNIKRVFAWLFLCSALVIFLLGLWAVILAALYLDFGITITLSLLFGSAVTAVLLWGKKLKGKRYDMFKKWKFLK